MEIKVLCNNLIELNYFKNTNFFKLNVLTYTLNKNTLTGDIKITGEYLKEDDSILGFEDIVPYTLVFRNDNIKINKIYTSDESIENIINKGIDLSFNLIVEYELLEKYITDDDKMNDINKENNDNEEEQIIEVPVETEEEIEKVDNIINESNVDDMFNEAKEITKQYEQLLNDLLTFKEERNEQKEYNTFILKNQKTTFNKICIYYLNSEKEIEKIAKNNNVSINEIYNKNNDIEKTRRIIINE